MLIITYTAALKLLSYTQILGIPRLLSLDAMGAPLVGLLSGSRTCVVMYLIRTALSFSVSAPLGSFLFHLPTLTGALILSSEEKILPRLVASLCIVTFLLHPVGYECFSYSLFWLIPIAISFVSMPSVFLRSLSSTFITHAVGSTLFIYTHTTTSGYWHALIPQVWLERIISALFLTALYYVVYISINFIHQLHCESNPCQNHSACS